MRSEERNKNPKGLEPNKYKIKKKEYYEQHDMRRRKNLRNNRSGKLEHDLQRSIRAAKISTGNLDIMTKQLIETARMMTG